MDNESKEHDSHKKHKGKGKFTEDQKTRTIIENSLISQNLCARSIGTKKILMRARPKRSTSQASLSGGSAMWRRIWRRIWRFRRG